MAYYILYPRTVKEHVKVVNTKPTPAQYQKKYGFAEGPLRTLRAVAVRLNMMNIPNSRRPAKVKWSVEKFQK